MASSYMSGALSVRRLTSDRHYQKYVTPEKTTDCTYYQVKLPTCICCRDYISLSWNSGESTVQGLQYATVDGNAIRT